MVLPTKTVQQPPRAELQAHLSQEYAAAPTGTTQQPPRAPQRSAQPSRLAKWPPPTHRPARYLPLTIPKSRHMERGYLTFLLIPVLIKQRKPDKMTNSDDAYMSVGNLTKKQVAEDRDTKGEQAGPWLPVITPTKGVSFK